VLLHFGDSTLRSEKEAVEVDTGFQCIVFGGLARERLGHENAPVVHQRVDAAKTGDRFGNHVASGFRIGDVAGNRGDVEISDGLLERAVATTRSPRARNALNRSAPMPCDASVTTTTFCDVLIESLQVVCSGSIAV
jgi:hypothetical protein